MPDNSFSPITIALGLAIFAYGAIFNWLLAVVGVIVIFAGVIRWVREPR